MIGTIEALQHAVSQQSNVSTLQRCAIERALADGFKLCRRTTSQKHPAEFSVERYYVGGGVTVEKMATTELRVWVGQWSAKQTSEGWVPNEFAEVADRAVGVVENFRKKLDKPKLVVVG